MFNEELSYKIKCELLKRKIKQTDLAKKFGVSLQCVSAIINGKYQNLRIESKILEELEINDTRTNIR